MNRDFRDLLAAFNDHSVDYIVVGAHALAAHGHVRATRDLDVWIRPEASNAGRVFNALKGFGAALQDLSEADLMTEGTVFQIGVPPLRIDLITSIDGIDFDTAWTSRFTTRFADQTVSVLSREHLIINKLAAGRTQDLADVEWLESQED